ncbi:AMP-dependent synthetase/ligase [Solimonas variicoloris]|uniref:AMP-dependent synthetase/ligase n=1 Tax=Solimonas variicoloris TaxID=254408 RepID=UPI000382D308|nr:long-chain fatty acid--CoA ligase [Solimonas variicoloris]
MNDASLSAPAVSAGTLSALFAARVAATPDTPAYRQFDAARGQWQALSWSTMAARVDAWRRALGGLQLAAGARVAILLPNGLDAVAVDQACLACGYVPVPMHAIDNPASIAYILGDSDASVLIVAGAAQWAAIAAAGGATPQLRQVVLAGADETVPDGATVPVARAAEWLAAAAALPLPPAPAQPDDLAAIVYTSGTTGRPKGVMLTHRNVVANVEAVMAHFRVEAGDVFLSILPLSHTFERTIGYYLAVAAGAEVVYVRSIAKIAEDLRTVRPTIVVAVPRIYERLYAAVQDAQARSSALARWLFARAEAIGWRRHAPNTAGIAQRMLDAALWPLLDRLVARKLRAVLGGRVRIAVSGGAPLAPAVERCFVGMGVPLRQGYGMTESSPVVAANTVDDYRPGTVGRPLAGVEVRLGERDELQVRGPNVMRGYWKRPEDTQRTLLDGGWLRTGDQAALEDGRVRIIGRIKEIIVTSTGEKIAPGDLETAIIADPLFEQAFVIGDNRPFIAAFVVLEPGRWQALAAQLGVPADASGLASKAARDAALQRIHAATASFPRYAMPRQVRLTLDKWTIENGLMTPTLKLKRNALEARLADAVAEVYRAG